MEDYIGSTDLADLSGATFRQIDYWCREGVMEPEGDPTPGSGARREWNPKIIPKVNLLCRMSDAFHHAMNTETLKLIFDNYEKGEVRLETGITVSWEVE